jgi:hypothetical protein
MSVFATPVRVNVSSLYKDALYVVLRSNIDYALKRRIAVTTGVII